MDDLAARRAKRPYMRDEAVVLEQLPDNGLCKHGRGLGFCRNISEASGAILCSLPAGHGPEKIETPMGVIETMHSMAHRCSFILPGHEFHRMVVIEPFMPSEAERKEFFENGIMPEVPASWERCSCGAKILEHQLCGHIENRGRPAFTATDYGLLATYKCGCIQKIEIVKEG